VPEIDYVAAAAADANALRTLDSARAEVRASLLKNLAAAHGERKTQQELADACGLSRQRISQFLKEVREA
jgi:predicted transcriptional regulator